MHDFDMLLDRLSTVTEPVAFMVGAPLSLTYCKPVPLGVPDVPGVIARLTEWAKETKRASLFEKHMKGVSGGARYQAAFDFVKRCAGQTEVNRLVREFVLCARAPGAPTEFKGDGDPADWHLPRGTVALARLAVKHAERFGGPILTTNFDPLISLAIEQTGSRVQRRTFAGDGKLQSESEDTGGVEVVHLHGYWRNSHTLHLPKQLAAKRPQLQVALRELLRNRLVVVAAYGGWDDVFMKALADVAAESESNIEVLWALFDTKVDARAKNRGLFKRYEGHSAFAFYFEVDAHDLFERLLAQSEAPVMPAPAPGEVAAVVEAVRAGDERPIRLGQPGVFLPKFDVQPGSMVGGAGLIARLRAKLAEGGTATIGQVVTAIGLGGIGKSRLAWEYAHAHRDDYAGGVVWIDADQSRALIDGQLVQMARALRWVGPAAADDPSTLRMAEVGLGELRGALVVFDNVEAIEPLRELRGRLDPTCHVVMTSRLDLGGAVLDMEHLSIEAGVELLEQVSGRATVGEDRAAAEGIVAWAEGLPLALELVGGYLKRRPSAGWKATRERLEAHQLQAKVLEPGRPGLETPVHRGRRIEAALTLHPELFSEHPALAPALDMLAGLAASAMGIELLRALVGEVEADALDEALEVACTLRIVSREGEDGTRYRMHRLVREVYRAGREAGGALDDSALARLARWFEARRGDWQGTEVFGRDVAHLEAALAVSAQRGRPAGRARLRWLVAHIPNVQGRYAEAKEEVEAALGELGDAGDEALRFELEFDRAQLAGLLGEERAAVAAIEALVGRMAALELNPGRPIVVLQMLAYWLDRLRRHEPARDAARRALALAEQSYGAGDWRCAGAQSTLAVQESRLGGGAAAVIEARRAYETLRSQQGATDGETLSAHSNLSLCLDAAKDMAEALRIGQAVLDERTHLLGADHPQTLQARLNVAIGLIKLRRYDEARTFALASLLGFRRLYEDLHPAVVAARIQLIHCTRNPLGDSAPLALAQFKALRAELPPDHTRCGEIDSEIHRLSPRPLSRSGPIPDMPRLPPPTEPPRRTPRKRR